MAVPDAQPAVQFAGWRMLLQRRSWRSCCWSADSMPPGLQSLPCWRLLLAWLTWSALSALPAEHERVVLAQVQPWCHCRLLTCF
jgi:hypothetical protein